MDLGLFLSLVGAIAGSVAAITGVLVLMTLQETLQNPAFISAHKDFYLLRRINGRSPPC